jgi:hypothetical protein
LGLDFDIRAILPRPEGRGLSRISVKRNRDDVMGIEADAFLICGPHASGRALLLGEGAYATAIDCTIAVALAGRDWCAVEAALRLRAVHSCPRWGGS